jgi:hypothetical protein
LLAFFLKGKNNLNNLEKFVSYCMDNPYTTVDNVVSDTDLTRSQILTLLRKTYKVKKENRNSDVLRYGSYIPDDYIELIDIAYELDNINDLQSNIEYFTDMFGKIIYKKLIFILCIFYGKIISLDTLNSVLDELNYSSFYGSRNSFFSIRKDILYIIKDNDLI